MQLNTDQDGKNLINATINGFYRKYGNRHVRIFLHSEDKEWGWHYTYFLLDRKHVIRYGIGIDRGQRVGGVELAIGPSYFGPADFWSYEDSQRFVIEASTEGVEHNLMLLDEFLSKNR